MGVYTGLVKGEPFITGVALGWDRKLKRGARGGLLFLWNLVFTESDAFFGDTWQVFQEIIIQNITQHTQNRISQL